MAALQDGSDAETMEQTSGCKRPARASWIQSPPRPSPSARTKLNVDARANGPGIFDNGPHDLVTMWVVYRRSVLLFSLPEGARDRGLIIIGRACRSERERDRQP